MWKFFSRTLRTRTPAPPSQTAPRTDDYDGALAVAAAAPSIQNAPQKDLEVSRLKQPENVKDITQRILGQPSEADILLREYFGQSWKSNTQNKRGNSGGCGCENTSEHLYNGVSLGTVGIAAALAAGKVAFTTWKIHQGRRRQLFSDGLLQQESANWLSDATLTNIFKDEIHFYPSNCRSGQNRSLRSRLNILPETFSNSTILAAGSDVGSKHHESFEIRSHAAQSPQPVKSVKKLQPNKKSVTFDYDFTEDSQQSEESSNSLSDEAIEQFAEDTKGCSGATYDILGLQSVRAGNYKEAFQRFQLGAGEGYSKAHFNVGLCYEQGLGTRKDLTKAMESYEKAAHKGHAKAQHNLGLILLKKEQIVDKVCALRLLEKAALSGLVQAQSYLGSFLAKPGAFQNLKKAVKMFKLAAERGDVTSKYHLGICYERGLGGLKQDLLQAFDLYSSTASAGNLDAKYQMAVMLNVGFEGLDKDSKLAHELLVSAVKSGHRPSQKLVKQWQTTRGNVSKREITTSTEKSFKVYYTPGASAGFHAPKQPHSTTDHPLLTLEAIHKSNETENKLHANGEHDQLHQNLMAGILSRHLADVKLMNEFRAPQFNYKRAGSNVDLQFPSQSHGCADVADILRMPRSSTTPNLRYHSPVLKDPVNAFSLNV